MRKQILPAIVMVILMTVLLGGVFPLVVTGISQVAFKDKADGSLVKVDGQVVGSELIGQAFTGETYFWPRPSAAGDGYDAMASSASNLGPTNEELLSAVGDRADAFREANDLPDGTPVPVDAVTSSASGLDPHISVVNARLQAPRVAAARDLDVDTVFGLITDNTDPATFGVLGVDGVNVLTLNIALDQQG